jgi:hypothetical protein
MSNIINERHKRRSSIIEGISQNLKHSEIAANLGVNRWVITNDLKRMRYKKDLELLKAQNIREQIRINEKSDASAKNERFLNMTGMTIKEKSFRNMIEFNKNELLKILKSEEPNSAIMKLPKSIRRSLMNNGIITKGWHNRELTAKAQKYLSNL